MAKGQKRSNKETRKTKDPTSKGKKQEGPKYLREAESFQAVRSGVKLSGRKN